jgi:Ca-activated chloride channel family protein
MNWLGPFAFDAMAYPRLLWLLPAVLLLFAAEYFARAPGAVLISTGGTLASLAGGARQRLRHLPAVLRAVGLALLLIALAGPLNGYDVRKDRASVIDIMLTVDVSGSMTQQDFTYNGRPVDRLFIAKQAVADFIRSRKFAGERFGADRLGLILFAGIAWTQCPLTLDYAILERELANAQIDNERKDKEGTAIGSALGLSVRRLSQSEAKSKVCILLTDGINNKGELDPMTAAHIAKEYGIRVYTIGAGSTEEGVVWGGNVLMPVQRQPIDEDSLRQIAELTGGRYYRATDTQSLMKAYEEIDALERTEIDAGDYYEYREAFLPYAISGGLLLLAAAITRRRWFEALP